jgi:deoxycytidylate deaminase
LKPGLESQEGNRSPGFYSRIYGILTVNNSKCVFQYGHVIQVGACIVNSERKIVGIGYNGMPNRCSDDELPWQREADNKLDTKYPYGRTL